MITTLFFDLGGVCLSNGWDHEQREEVVSRFGFDYAAFDARHRQVVDALERGQLSLEEYLSWTVFYEPRPFALPQIVTAIEEQSTAIPEMLDLIGRLKQTCRYGLMTLNNESLELNEFRIHKFGLRDLFSAFFSSCYLGLTKPQPEFYRRVLHITQREPEECVFVDDRPMNVEVAAILGMQTVLFRDAAQLTAELKRVGAEF